jgi:hypothetical protein
MPRRLLALIIGNVTLAVIGAVLLATLVAGGKVSAGGPHPQIDVGDNWFCAPKFSGGVCDTTIPLGDTVIWFFGTASGTHSSRECGASCNAATMNPLWNSGFISDGSAFQFTFDQAGTYLYRCEVHPIAMRGRIIVQGGVEATPTNTPPGFPTPTNTPPSQPTPTRTPPFVVTSTPTVPPARPGDVNCGGSVNSIDAALVLQFGAGLLHSLSCPQNGDMNGDGHTNSVDAALILQRVAGLI